MPNQYSLISFSQFLKTSPGQMQITQISLPKGTEIIQLQSQSLTDLFHVVHGRFKNQQKFILIFIQSMRHIWIFSLIILFALGLFSANALSTTTEEINLEKLEAVAVSYPVRLAYIDRINQWWPPQKIADSIGVPGYATSTIYNYIALAFWSYSSGPLDIVNIWADPVKFFGPDSPFGNTKDSIQKFLKKKYNDNGVKILISAFGATEFPTTNGVDPIACADKLGAFVNENNLDGVDIDWQDNSAMEAGKGEDWLIKFQTQLRKLLPNHLITHAPQAPYFKQQFYKNGAYVTVHKNVGSTIDFYNVQFYNQGDTMYNTYDRLFVNSGSTFSGTAVNEIIKRGIPSKKIVIGKPVTQGDAANTGWVNHDELGKWVAQAYQQNKWFAGIMYWQYVSDVGGNAIKSSAGFLKEQCAINKDCK